MFFKKSPFILSLFLILNSTSCMKKSSKNEALKNAQKPSTTVFAHELKVDNNKLSIDIAVIKTVHGNIVIKFYATTAPNTVTRIIQLIREGFYDGLTFHRVIKDFIIQTGDPTGSGRGGTGNKLKAELSDLQHILGTVSMARSPSDIDSADSQFYISLGTLPNLDGKYTIFGQVVDGLDVIKKINAGDKIISAEFIRKK